MDLIDMLIQFGLTRQEAVIYLALCADGSQTGYEVAKGTGISRSNAYTALAALVDKGAAYTVEDNAVRYSPVPVTEFCENKILRMQKIMDLLIADVPQSKNMEPGYITIKGQTHILDKMRHMILEAKERIYLSASGSILMHLMPELQKATNAGLKVVFITDATVEFTNATIYTKKPPIPVRIIVDSSFVLTGDVHGEDPTCLYSAKKNLVDLIKDSLKNELQLIEIMRGR